MNSRQQDELIGLVAQPVQWRCRLDRYTSFAIGGPADAVVKVERREELQALLAFLAEEQLPWRVIGRGTNLLVKDGGFAGIILVLEGEFKKVNRQASQDKDGIIVRAGSGYSLTQLAHRCMEWGYSGVEFACGIPGTLGGAMIMNAGAWGSDMSAIVAGVGLMTAEGEKRFVRKELDFSYRCWHDFVPYLGRAVVVEVELALQKSDPDIIRQQCDALQDQRKKVQGCSSRNAGSFFKNPSNDSAGRLIDASGLKGMTVGGAMVSLHHANFLVNKGGATSDDVVQLMQIVQAKVKIDSGIDLEPEVHFI